MTKIHLKTGDQVFVNAGDDAGKKGKILEVNPRAGKILVDGINIQKKHTRPTQTNPQGGIVDRPGPIDASNVSLICPSCHQPTRISRHRTETGEVTRHCKRCEKSID